MLSAAMPFIFTRRLGHILHGTFYTGSYKKKKEDTSTPGRVVTEVRRDASVDPIKRFLYVARKHITTKSRAFIPSSNLARYAVRDSNSIPMFQVRRADDAREPLSS